MQATALTAAVRYVDSDTGRNYTVKLIPENVLTDDPSGRFPVGPIGWREGRLPFTFSDVEGQPHEEARHVGNLFNLRRENVDGTMWVVADLDWDIDELALEAKRLVDEDRITGVSIHPTDLDAFLICGVPDNPTAETVAVLAEQFNPDECAVEDWVEAWINIVIGSATLLMLPAFEEAEVVTADAWTNLAFDNKIDSDGKPWVTSNRITVRPAGNGHDDEVIQAALDALTASDIKRPPSDWFTDPELDGPSPLQIDDEGRVKGHLALWSTCHRGFDSQCVTPPRDSTDYGEFHSNARVIVESGESLGVGCLTFDVSHADIRASTSAAKRHYDHSGTVAAFVRAGQDEHGVWVAGAIRPGLSDDQVEMMRRLSLSGDWRPKGGTYHLIAAQAVPVPGFPIRARVASGEVSELTTRGPVNDYQQLGLEPVSDLALIASALFQTNQKLDQLLEEKGLRDYEKALAAFS